MPQDSLRAACPACGKRFSLAASDLPEAGAEARSARCRSCGHAFGVRRGSQDRAAIEGEATALPMPPEAAERETLDLGVRLGRYEIEGILGRGGMGTVYRAYDPAANRHVALKVLASDASELDTLRFRREIEVQANVQHPHIMPIFDSGVVGRARFYAMELLKDPVDLIELVQRVHSGEAAKDPRFRPVATLEGMVERILLPLCDAVHHGNVNEGVLHRDIKPGNVLVDRATLRPYLIDYGVSTLLEKKNTRLAHMDRELPVPLSGKGIHVTGTLVFMPPEQARGQADKRGDVWGLGALLHYIVTEHPPLKPVVKSTVSRAARIEGLQMLIDEAQRSGDAREVDEFRRKLAEVSTGRERGPEDLRADVLAGAYAERPAGVDRGLEAIIARAMNPIPERRFRHAAELQDDLKAWLQSLPVGAVVRESGAAGGALYRTRLFVRRHARVLGLLLLLLVGGAVVSLLWPSPPTQDGVRLGARLAREAQQQEAAGERGAARRVARDALRANPDEQQALDLLARMDQADRFDTALVRARELGRRLRAAALAGDLVLLQRLQGALDETLSASVKPLMGAHPSPSVHGEIERLERQAAGRTRITARGVGEGTRFFLLALARPKGPLAAGLTRVEVPSQGLDCAPGAYVLVAVRGAGEVWTPFETAPGREATELHCAVDAASVDASQVYVGAGDSHGPGGVQSVPALLWDRLEVTEAQYSHFLQQLPPEERRRRVPRMAGPLGGSDRPLWDAQGDAFLVPSGASLRPVEGISLYDARAYAAWCGKRLPTAAEWARAASPDGRLTPLGSFEDLLGAQARLDAPVAGVATVGRSEGDLNPFGLRDLAGNVSEFTSTRGRRSGTTGWWVMGGSYRTPATAALVREARVVSGWRPQEGVGLRCVKDVAP